MYSGMTSEISGIMRVPRIPRRIVRWNGNFSLMSAYAASDPTTRAMIVTLDETIRELSRVILKVLATSEVLPPGVRILM
jgi:hypothetical protein